MKLGLCTTDFTVRPADALFGRLSELGVGVTQFAFCSVLESDFTPDESIEIPESIPAEAMRAITREARRHAVAITAINGTFNMCHPDEEVRMEGVKRFAVLCQAAEALGCSILSLCSGTRSRTSLWTYDAHNGDPAAWHDMSESMKRVCELASAHDLTLAIETEASNIIDTPEKARRILDEVGYDGLKMILDAANLFLPGKAKRENVIPTLDHAFELFGKDIVLVHGKDIKESDGIDFCAAGEGIVDFAYMTELLKKAHYDGDFILHGIYDEEKMPHSLALIRQYI